MSRARFTVVEDTDKRLIIRDTGHWDNVPTITNDVEAVVRDLADHLGGRQLFYYDSDGRLDEIVVSGGQFIRFRPGPEEGKR